MNSINPTPPSVKRNALARPAFLSTTTTAVSAILLTGCTLIAPGHTGVSSGTGPSSNDSKGWATFSDTSRGSVVQITPEVISTMDGMLSNKVSSDVTALFATPQPYTIGPGDVVGIVVYDHPELMPSAGAVISQQVDPAGVSTAPGLIVGADGEISYPYIGRVKLLGLTEVQANSLITEKLAAFIKDPQITLRIQAFRSRRAYLEGEVRTPGMQIFTDRPMSLLEAINRAGGITSNGDRSNLVLTRDGRSTAIDLSSLQTLGVDVNRILLKDGDTIQVRNRDERKVYVMGESLRPSALLMRDGKLSLGQALGESGGVNSTTADPGQIYVIRKQADGSPSVFHLNAKDPTMLAVADTFNLQPRDVVYIDPVGLVRWNRIISLIVPSANVLNAGSEINSR